MKAIQTFTGSVNYYAPSTGLTVKTFHFEKKTAEDLEQIRKRFSTEGYTYLGMVHREDKKVSTWSH